LDPRDRLTDYLLDVIGEQASHVVYFLTALGWAVCLAIFLLSRS